MLQSLHIFHLHWPVQHINVTDTGMNLTWAVTSPTEASEESSCCHQQSGQPGCHPPSSPLAPRSLDEIVSFPDLQMPGMLGLRGLRHPTQLHRGKVTPKDTQEQCTDIINHNQRRGSHLQLHYVNRHRIYS